MVTLIDLALVAGVDLHQMILLMYSLVFQPFAQLEIAVPMKPLKRSASPVQIGGVPVAVQFVGPLADHIGSFYDPDSALATFFHAFPCPAFDS